ncbi:MAG: LacI family transcriptional regulator [Novosphingobium sp. 28-62-57]|uniref:LacI family DNA-binding transcriptional regulator n=1 Tax=unclassified Novosphingobium TaxID=2644732 RepID=UPI000BCD4E0B|nr:MULTISPECIES: LacI family DNA-binding transcriptional regulator [unclassified Novosphingobium]OYW48103.1 MAG: LacI family transcriptional regulator [Novosphingobium sp. 12-63-9]OYZ08613.1 MAG: LacI family transcriptional regulator [Novosphingobium sp. 28-62-57]OZA36116.1 MAG: LacI family transcriptional regulator [Novosphingobium sp. 17-62-9]HQS69688.1 LacI family DNA-binding transcriptional regulator [Novosphingobium sp.]
MARRRQAVTIKHVAADAGVSLQTVSRVINNEANVRAEMREKVQASIDKLGYVPSIAAQRMSGSRSYLILALNDRERTIADWRARQGTDWVDQMLLGGMLECAEHGYRLIFELVDTHSDHVERELSAAIAALQPDGAILTPPHSDNPQILEVLARHNIPFARIGAQSGEHGLPEGICVSMDDEGGAKLATSHLLELGHRRIGMISGPAEYRLAGARVDGWRAAMDAAGCSTEGLLEAGDFTFASGARAARALLMREDRPTAIIASNDQMALATSEIAGELGLAIPADLSLVSFDNTPLVRFTRPALTAVDQPIAETTATAVRLLISLQRDDVPRLEPVIIPMGFVVRGSTGAPVDCLQES